MQLLGLEYYSFSQLLTKWNCDKEYLHHIIAHSKIIPAIRLPFSKQIPSGVFLDGIPDDIEGFNNVHGNQSYQEYCNAADESDPFWYEKLIPFTSFVYCHSPQVHPTDNTPNNYIFQYFNEISDKTKVDKWFYGGGNIISNKEDGERLFIFTREEINRVEILNNLPEKLCSTISEDLIEASGDTDGFINLSESHHPKPITLSQIVIAFGSFHSYGNKKNYDLKAALQDKSKWSKCAKMSAGGKGRGNESTWNPVKLAEAMIDHYEIKDSEFTKVFQNKDFLSDWHVQWKEYIERKTEISSY